MRWTLLFIAKRLIRRIFYKIILWYDLRNIHYNAFQIQSYQLLVKSFFFNLNENAHLCQRSKIYKWLTEKCYISLLKLHFDFLGNNQKKENLLFLWMLHCALCIEPWLLCRHSTCRGIHTCICTIYICLV